MTTRLITKFFVILLVSSILQTAAHAQTTKTLAYRCIGEQKVGIGYEGKWVPKIYNDLSAYEIYRLTDKPNTFKGWVLYETRNGQSSLVETKYPGGFDGEEQKYFIRFNQTAMDNFELFVETLKFSRNLLGGYLSNTKENSPWLEIGSCSRVF
jgi:hypothetical protein